MSEFSNAHEHTAHPKAHYSNRTLIPSNSPIFFEAEVTEEHESSRAKAAPETVYLFGV